MYERHFDLKEKPFGDRLDTRVFVSTPDREEALAAMTYAAQHAPAHVLLTGPAGVGKTLLVRVFISRLPEAERVIVLAPPPEDESGLLAQVCQKLNVGSAQRGGAAQRLTRLNRQLAQVKAQGVSSILLIDEAERLTPAHLIELEQLTELRSNDERLLSIVLVGQPSVRTLLDDPSRARLRQLFFMESVLQPVAREGMPGYLQLALASAGDRARDLFPRDAADALHAASGGLPRMINRLADAALLAAYGAGKTIVHAGIVREVGGAAQTPEPKNPPVMQETKGSSDQGRRHDMPVDSLEPFDWSAASSSQDAFMQENHSASNYHDFDGHHASPTCDDMEMVSIACSAAPYLSQAQMPQISETESAAPQDLLERLEKAVRLFGQPASSAAHPGGKDRKVRRAAQAIEAEDRLRDMLNQTESRMADMERRMARMLAPMEQLERRRANLEQICAEARQTEGRLSGYAERIAHTAAVLQERAGALTLGTEIAEQAHERLSQLVEDAGATAKAIEARLVTRQHGWQDMDERAESMRTGVAHTLDEAREMRRLLDELVIQASTDHARATAQTRTLCAELADATTRAGEAIIRQKEESERALTGQLNQLIEHAERKLRETVNTALTEWDKAAARRDAERLAQVQAMDAQHEAWQTGLNNTAMKVQENHERCLMETTGKAAQQITALVHRVESTATSVQERLVALDSDSTATLAKVKEQLDAYCADARRAAATVYDSLDQALARGRGELETFTLQAEQCRAEAARERHSMTEQLTTDLDELHARGEIIQNLAQSAATCVDSVQHSLAHTSAQTDAVAKTIDGLCMRMNAMQESGETALSRLSGAVAESDAKVRAAQAAGDRVESLHRQSANLLVDMGAHCERAQSLLKQLPQGEELARRMDEQMAGANNLLSRLPGLLNTAGEEGDRLTTLNAASGDLATRLQSHHAAAVAIVRQLSDGTIAAHDLLQDLRQTLPQAREAATMCRADVERARQSLAERQDALQDAIRQVTAQLTMTQETVSHLDSLRATATGEVESLSQQLHQAEQTIISLRERSSAAAGAADRLAELAPMLERGTACAGELRESTALGRQIHDALATANDAAAEQHTRLHQTCAIAERAASAGEEMRRRLEATTEEYARTVEAIAQSSAAQQDMLKQYLEDSAQIGQTMETLHHEVERLSGEVDSALRRPHDVLRSATEQTVQLESVCVAVRKVFANLAQTSMQARSDIQAFESQSVEASKRSAQLSEETNRAAATLQLWVQEAVHVQTRLEQTLKQSPALSQTHPGEVLKSMSRLAKPITPATGTNSLPREETATPADQENPASAVASILREVRAAKGGSNR